MKTAKLILGALVIAGVIGGFTSIADHSSKSADRAIIPTSTHYNAF